MATKEWTLPVITSAELRRLIESFRIHVPENPNHPSFTKCLLSAIRCEIIVARVNSLSKKAVVLQTNISSHPDFLTTGSIYVFEVEVVCTQDTLIVREKDAAKKDSFFRPSSGNVIKVIWIYSKSVNIIDAKFAVFQTYESYLNKETIYLHHRLDDAENVMKFSAFQQVKSLGTVVESISESVPVDSLEAILQLASDKVLSKDTIRELCYDIFLKDKSENVGTCENASYSCRSVFTVRRLKEQLVDKTLNKTAETLGSEICRGILKYIESRIKTKLEKNFSDLKFNISDELFATITVAVVAVVVSFFFPLLGIIIAVGTLVVTFVWSVDVNSREWRRKVADEIYDTIAKNKNDILRKIRPQVEQMCQQTVQELTTVAKTIHEFKCRIGQTEQKALVHEWKKRDIFKNKDVLKKHTSILTFLAGTRDGVPVVKVFLTGKEQNKKTENDLLELDPTLSFEFVYVDSESEKCFENMKKIENLEQSAPVIDEETRKKMNEVINRHAEKVFANHSNIIGMEISNMRSDNHKMVNELCIVLLCLDASILPFGESPLPKNLEDYPCDFRRDIITFGHCVNCQSLNIGCSIGIPSVQSAGSVGFFVKSNDSKDVFTSGFLTAAHVAIQQYDELYEHNSLFSQHSLANSSHQIVHPSCLDNAANNVIGEVIESIFGNYGPTGTAIDAAFVKTYQQKEGEQMHLADEGSLDFEGSMMVKKRGRTTGVTLGKLVDKSGNFKINSKAVIGKYYNFKNCFVVQQINENSPFFAEGDSGSGVFLIDEKDGSLKPLGIAFAFSHWQSKTFVCKIEQITNAFDVSVYEDEELMDTS